jgi:mono/diheme cytochrome c family protein
MRSPVRLVIMIVLLLSVALAATYILITPGLKPMVISVYGPPEIEAENRIRDVGTVETDSHVKTDFVLYNVGGNHLRIFNVDTSCGCTVANVTKRVIAPGDFTRIQVALDTSIKVGNVRKKITVFSNDPKRPQLALFLVGDVLAKKMAGHAQILLQPKDRLVLFKGQCATCHVQNGIGKTGKALFQADCAMCHGSHAQGNHSSGPSLLSKNYESEALQKHWRDIIADGSPHSPQMPPFSKAKGGPLTDDEIDSLVSFLKFQNLQNKMGLLNQEDAGEQEDEAAFQKALQQPH